MKTLSIIAFVASAALAAAPAQRVPVSIAGFDQLVEEYRRGEANLAVAALAKWPEKRLRAETAPPKGMKDTRALTARAALLTEAGIASGRFGAFAEGRIGGAGLGFWGLEKAFESFSYHAYLYFERIIEPAEDTEDQRLLDVARNWYIVAMCFCHDRGRALCTRSLLEKGDWRFGDYPDFRLTMGSLAQNTRMTRERADGIPYMRLQDMSQEPIWLFKQALKADPALVEARLRLGHTLHVFLNYPDAVEHLARVLSEARAAKHAMTAYLAALFLGEIHEDDDELEEASRYYRIAVDTQRAHTASVALGETLVRMGHRGEGFDVGRLMFGREGPGVEPVMDPYFLYHSAQYYQQGERLAAMRRMVRQ